jgi:adhesin transport system outer membrane protein
LAVTAFISPLSYAQAVPDSAPVRSVSASAEIGDAAQNDNSLALLRHMVLTAVERSPQIREADAMTRAARMDTDEAKGARWPRLDVSAASRALDYGGSNVNGDGAAGRVGLTATYNLYDAGRTNSQIQSLEFTELSEAAKVAQIRDSVTYDTVNAYLQVIKQQRIITLYTAHIERLSTLVNKLEQIVTAFVGRRSELTQAITRLGQARDGLASAVATQRENRLVLTRLLGSEALIPVGRQQIPRFQPLTPAQAIPLALDRHPLLLSGAAKVQSLKAAVKTINAAQRPQLDLQATKLSGKDVTGNSTPAQIYLGVKWNAFNGFSGKSAERAALARAESAEERYRQSKIEIEYRIRSAWSEFQTNSERAHTLRSLAQDTDQVRQDYYVQWNDLARRSLLEVLTAENDHLATLVGLTSSEVDQELALARVRFEAGELAQWLVGPPQAVPAFGVTPSVR